MIAPRIGVFIAIATLSVTPAAAQCYQFFGSGVTLKINIASINLQLGPISLNGLSQTDYVFTGTNSFTLGSTTLSSNSTSNGAADIGYQPAIGNFPNLTTFTISVPNADSPGPGSHSWVASLGGVGDLIPSHLLPQALPPISAWTGVGGTNYIEIQSGSARTKFPITAIATCSVSDPGTGGGGVSPTTGSLAHMAAAAGWDTLFTAVNLGSASATAHADFYADSGSTLTLPLNIVPSVAGPSPTPTPASSFDHSLGPNASVVIDATGPAAGPLVTGWSQFQTSSGVSGFGVFRFPQLKWEAVVPLEIRNASSYLLAFDNTGTVATGVAVANVATQAAHIIVIVRDDSGTQIATSAIDLPALGHTSFMLNQFFSGASNKRGTVEFQTPGFGSQVPGRISVLGLRANGGALTTLPVLASSDTPGGAIAHATYNGGFTSLFYLVNTGAASASFTLSFFDESGNPLSVPLSLPQSGATTITSTLTRTLAAGAMLVVETQTNDAAASIAGSAQLTTTGAISGFEIFRWTPFGQEASVPLETRTPASLVLMFDDTNGLTTGVALANQNAAAANVNVKIFDDAGALLQTASINLTSRGHTSFLLPNTYATTANRRGMVEFIVPQGGKISAVGLRATADGTLTTIPVLAK